MMNKRTVVLFAGAVLLTATQVKADTITKPYTFTNGTPANATEVNADFDTVYGQVNKMGNLITADDINGILNVYGSLSLESESSRGSISTTRYSDSASSLFIGKRARGTMASPSPVLNGDNLATFGGYGYGASGWPVPSPLKAMMRIVAAEDWTGIGNGADITFETTANGSSVNTEKMRITGNGNVGIGTTTPTGKLEVASDFSQSGLAALYISSYFDSGSNHPAHIYGQRARGSMAMPSPVLNGDYIFMLGPKGYNALNGFSHGYNGSISFFATEDFVGAGMGTGLSFSTTPNGSTARVERMRIDQNGDVGIGTTTPESDLEIASDYAVNGSPSRLYLTTYRNDSSGSPSVLRGRRARGSLTTPAPVLNGDQIFSIGSVGYRDTGWGSQFYNAAILFSATENFTDTATGSSIHFKTTPNSTTTSLDRMTIDQSGYVGIGTTAPERNLDIVADVAETGADGGLGVTTYYDGPGHPSTMQGLRARGSKYAPAPLQAGDKILSVSGKGYDGVSFGSGGPTGPVASMQFIATENYTQTTKGAAILFHTTPNGTTTRTERMRIDQNGNVGIGTSNPQATLDVNGFMKLAKNAAEPVTCDVDHDGALALTSGYRMCVCDGSSWVFTSDGSTGCSW